MPLAPKSASSTGRGDEPLVAAELGHRGVGSRDGLLRGKPGLLTELYRSLEKALHGYGGVEVVAKDRYALFRTTRIFADLVFTRDSLRLAILLDREASDP